VTKAFSYGHRRHRRSRLKLLIIGAVSLSLAGSIMVTGAIATNTLGAGERFANLLERIDLIVDPPPDRPTAPTVERTPRPVAQATAAPPAQATPAPTDGGSAATDPAPSAEPTPEPTPRRAKVDFKVTNKPKQHFASQGTTDWCAPAGVQMTLAVLGLADTSAAFQEELVRRAGEWESKRDSRNGGWGPGAMVQALDAYGARGYEIRAYRTRADALLDAARAITETESPAILLAWRGAHTWVMTGYTATADPMLFDDSRVTGTYILDPWYPRISTIWGPSDPAGTFQDAAEMRRNFLPWQRPEGSYPDRDGRWLIVVPTIHASELG